MIETRQKETLNAPIILFTIMMTIIPTASKLSSIFSLILFLSTVACAQNKYPKETIYIMFEKDSTAQKVMNLEKNNKKGIAFSVGSWDDNSIMAFFYYYCNKVDTLHIRELKKFKFEKNRKEIEKKETQWLKKKFNGMTPYGDKNGVFNTYLIEIIPDNRFVVYPVEWVGGGVVY